MAKKNKKQASEPPKPESPPPSSQPPARKVGILQQVPNQPATTSTGPSIGSILRSSNSQKALQLVVLAALYSPVSQLNLSPVYGSIPSSLYHRWGLSASVLLTFALRGSLPRWIGNVIPAYCFWIPTIQFILFKFSSTFGNPLGPLITEIFTYYPLVSLSIYVGVQLFDELKQPQYESPFTDALPALGLFIVFSLIQRGAKTFVPTIIGSKIFNTRVGFQMVLATLYSLVLIPSGGNYSMFLPAIPSVAFTVLGNPHSPLVRTTEVLNNTLAMYDYTVLDRRESLTGYISVLEDQKQGFRVMRCDHSLLGGEWKLSDADSRGGRSKPRIAEPIYAIFTMLEAVRLVETPLSKTPDSKKTALVIGLGVGTAPSALIAHGINTTIIELDPVVHDFAVQYFHLPHNHSIYIGDAVGAVATSARNTLAATNTSKIESYDFIVHDVFTGGAEPVALFTREFLRDLYTLLNPAGGVIAINYAGDLSMPSASMIYRTVTSVFGKDSCRVFREEAELEPASTKTDFTNMIFFCTKIPPNNAKHAPLRFRTPSKSDFLGSDARRQFMLPQHELHSQAFQTDGPVLSTLDQVSIRDLSKHQAQSAIGHWHVMRTVLPDGVWENW